MYKNKENCNLEEVFVTGHRIQRFLLEFVPQHPDYSKPRSWHLRNKSRREVKTLQFCLEDIAVLIDEQLCNEVVDFAPEFDRMLLQDQESDCPVKPTNSGHSFGRSHFDNWVAFGGWQKGKDTNDESFDSTLDTTGSDSIDNLDSSVDDDYAVTAPKYHVYGYDEMPDREHENIPKTARVIFPLNLSESAEEDHFLSAVAKQKFSFELDSDACDSWAQGHSLRHQKAKHLKHDTANTCDPAEIMFRHVLKVGSIQMKSAGVRSKRVVTRAEFHRQIPIGGEHGPKLIIGSALESGIDQGRVIIARHSIGKDDDTQYVNEMYPALPNSASGDRTHARFEDDYLVAGVEPKSQPTPKEVASTLNEGLRFHNFDCNALAEDEWIDFGGTGIDSF